MFKMISQTSFIFLLAFGLINIEQSNAQDATKEVAPVAKKAVADVDAAVNSNLGEIQKAWSQSVGNATSTNKPPANQAAAPLSAEEIEIAEMLAQPQIPVPMLSQEGLESLAFLRLEKFAKDKLVPLLPAVADPAAAGVAQVEVALNFHRGENGAKSDALHGATADAWSSSAYSAFQKSPNKDANYELTTLPAESGVFEAWSGEGSIRITRGEDLILVKNLAVDIKDSRNLIVARSEYHQHPALFNTYDIRFVPNAIEVKESTVAYDVDMAKLPELSPKLSQAMGELKEMVIANQGVFIEKGLALETNPTLPLVQNAAVYEGEKASQEVILGEIASLTESYNVTRDEYVDKLADYLEKAKSISPQGSLNPQMQARVTEVEKGIAAKTEDVTRAYDAQLEKIAKQEAAKQKSIAEQAAALGEEKDKLLEEFNSQDFKALADQRVEELQAHDTNELQARITELLMKYKPESELLLQYPSSEVQ